MSASRGSARFGRSYYERYYERVETRVVTREEIARRASFVCAYLRYLELPVRRVLDLGCGLGWWRAPVAHHYPRARYVGVEISEYLCERHGWELGSVVDYRARAPFDLVICQGVLQYLSDAEARAAIENLGRLCRGALYLEALTREDWEQHCDRERTDGDVVLRCAAWYRRRLAPAFRNAGGGLFVHRDGDAVLYELEQL